MPNVIVNTSPIQYLYQVNLLDLLPALYDQIMLPESVFNELATGLSLGVSLPNVSSLSWVTIAKAKSQAILPLVTELGAGEREVLALALETTNSLVILDDGLARSFATLLEIRFTGTLGVLLKAKQMGYISAIRPILEQLNALNFRCSSSMRNSVLKLAGE